MQSREQVGKTVMEAIRQTLAAKGISPPALGPGTAIDGSLGLDSLDWAAVIVRLEESTGVDPFEKALGRELKTIQDLTSIYTEALGA